MMKEISEYEGDENEIKDCLKQSLKMSLATIHNLYDEHKEDEGLSLDQIHCLRRALQSILIVHQIKKR